MRGIIKIIAGTLGAIAVAAVLSGPTANATPLACTTNVNASQTVFPTSCDSLASPGTLLASRTEAWTTTTGGDTGSLSSAVYRNSTGTLDFYYQVSVNTACPNPTAGSCDQILINTDSNFFGFTTGVGFIDAGGTIPATFSSVGTLINPFSADKLPNGSGVDFNFPTSSPNGGISPGQKSAVLIISTNATNFMAGFAAVQDTGNATVASYQPAAAVPEPASLGLMGLGLLALGGIRKTLKK